MKKVFLLILFCYFVNPIFSQEELQMDKFSTIPSVAIKTLEGKNFNTKNIDNEGKPIIISLWATWCRPCIEELAAIAEVYDDWIEETGVKVYAISIDDSKTAARVMPFVNGRAWDYEVLQDINSDFKRAMNVIDIPFLCILNENREIVWKHTSYAPGNENEVFEVLKKMSK